MHLWLWRPTMLLELMLLMTLRHVLHAACRPHLLGQAQFQPRSLVRSSPTC